MKRPINLITGMALACCLTACQDLQTDGPSREYGENLISATFESDPGTRTSLSPAGSGVYKVLWSENDALSVFIDGASIPNHFTLKDGSGTGKATFAGYGSGSRYIACYPPSEDITREGADAFRTALPEVQAYVPGTFASGNNPMVASGSSSQLVFRNLASIMKFSLTGNYSVLRIVFRPNDRSAKVAGPATVSVADPEHPTLTVSDNGLDSLTLNVGGVLLSRTEATDFYLVLPARTYKGGFSVRFYTATGYMEKEYASDVTLERSRVHETTAVKVKLTSGVEASEDLEGSGTATDPFRIGSTADLLLMQLAVNSEEGTVTSRSGKKADARKASYLLTKDLNLSPLCSERSGTSWEPIGTEKAPFNGTFDGGKHKITNLYIREPDKDNLGLFGVLGKNSRLSGISVEGTIAAGRDIAALLAGYCLGSVDNCSSSGSVKASGVYIAGLVALCDGSISDCSNHASINGFGYVAGIAAYSERIASCLNDGNINATYLVGGIAYQSTVIEKCVNKGNIHITHWNAGGIAGDVNRNSVIINCLNEGSVYAQTAAGGITGDAANGSAVYNCINTGRITGIDSDLGGIVGQCNTSPNFAAQGPVVENCLNLGTVASENESMYHVKNLGCICGNSMGKTSGSDYLDAEIRNCYWLYEPSAGFKLSDGIGLDKGISSNLFGLDRAQMKGADTGKELYRSKDGKVHAAVLDALNAWVADHPEAGSCTPSTWTKDSTTGYPALKL